MIEKRVGAFEAKTRLSALLREVEGGQTVLICSRGKAMARLMPVVEDRQAWDDIWEGFNRIRRQVKGKVSIKSAIEAGRRW